MSTSKVNDQYRSVVKVGATATASVEPDTAVFELRFGCRCKSQKACIDDYDSELAKVKGTLARFGIEEELKTSGYHTYAHRTGKKRSIDGYEYGSRGILKVKRESYDVGAIWQALSESSTCASFGLSFELVDERIAEDALIEDAVFRARSSAEALAQAAGMSLGGVKEIRYQREGSAFGPVLFDAAPSSGSVNFDVQPDFEPEPIEIECHVDIDWWLTESSC